MKHTKIAALAMAGLMLASCGVNLIPSKDDWYAKHYYIMQDYEWQIYKAIGPTARLEFQKTFWTVRSPNSWVLQQSTADEGRYRGQLELGNKNGFYAVEDVAAYKQTPEALKAIKEPGKK
jgi:hypothetical protein